MFYTPSNQSSNVHPPVSRPARARQRQRDFNRGTSTLSTLLLESQSRRPVGQRCFITPLVRLVVVLKIQGLAESTIAITILMAILIK
eukprot:8671188-Pyramimonas_sp.AAC.3